MDDLSSGTSEEDQTLEEDQTSEEDHIVLTQPLSKNNMNERQRVKSKEIVNLMFNKDKLL